MRILIATWSLQVGGGEVLAMNLAADLARRGHQVMVFNQNADLIDRALVQRLVPPQVAVRSMADKPRQRFWAYKINALQQLLGLEPTFYERRQQAYLAECLRHNRVELISSHATFSDRLCAPVAQRAGVPMVITEHGEYSRFIKEKRNDFAAVLQAAARLITVSKYNQQLVQGAFAKLPPVQTIYNGVVINTACTSEAMRHKLAIPAEAFVFGMVARGIEDKGWETAVGAFRRMREVIGHQPVRLVLVGGSSYLSDLQASCVADADIIFVGQVPDPDFYVAGFDVGLLPTHFRAEALPLAVIEYMMNGKPTIATRVGGISELLGAPSGSTGQLVDLDTTTGKADLHMVAEAMVNYCTTPALYATHKHNALLASEQFTMQACAAQYEQAFEEVLAASA